MDGWSLPSWHAVAQAFRPTWVLDDGQLSGLDFLHTSWMAVVLILVRAVADRTVLPALRARMAKQGKAGKARAVYDNLYIVGWSVATEALAVYVVALLNGGCKPWATDACLTGWPHHEVHVLQKWYQILMFQFYLHEMLGAVIGQQRMKTDMMVHHFATMGLISTAYSLNLNRYAIMWQALFDSSNPLLHGAKALHSADIKALDGIKWALFNSFALVFFVARVAAAPFAILYPSLTRGSAFLPRDWWLFLLALEFIVCGIQWVWFYRIVALATGQQTQGHEDEGEQRGAKDNKKAQ